MNATKTIKQTAQALSISLSVEDHNKIRTLAATHRLPVSAIIRLALRNGLPVVEKNLKAI